MPKYGINKVILLGNVGTAPELRQLEQGAMVCSFRMATTERFRTKEGTYADRTDWHNIVLWRQKAEIAAKYLKVGSGVYLEGRIVTRSWDGADGQKHYKTEVEVEKMRLLDALGTSEPGTESDPEPEDHKLQASELSQKSDTGTGSDEGPDDDLPF